MCSRKAWHYAMYDTLPRSDYAQGGTEQPASGKHNAAKNSSACRPRFGLRTVPHSTSRSSSGVPGLGLSSARPVC